MYLILQVACETFCLDDDDTLLEVALSLGSEALSAATVRFVEVEPQPIVKGVYGRFVHLYYLFVCISRFATYIIPHREINFLFIHICISRMCVLIKIKLQR